MAPQLGRPSLEMSIAVCNQETSTTTLSKTKGAVQKGKKTVRFASHNELSCIHTISNRRDISQQERQSFWYVKSEYKEMDKLMELQVKMMEDGVPEREPYCYMGLETDSQVKRRLTNNGFSVKAVLKTQKRCKRVSQDNPYSDFSHEQTIANVYRKHSYVFEKDCILQATQLEAEVWRKGDHRLLPSRSNSMDVSVLTFPLSSSSLAASTIEPPSETDTGGIDATQKDSDAPPIPDLITVKRLAKAMHRVTFAYKKMSLPNECKPTPPLSPARCTQQRLEERTILPLRRSTVQCASRHQKP